jgi:tetratricopeptide (TPR) repeat protein
MLEPYVELHKQGRLAEAEAGYREALAFNPDDPEALHLLAIVRRQQGDLVEAFHHARRAVELAPDRPNYLVTLAGLEFHGRLFDEAAAHFEAALTYDPNRADAYSGLGHIALLRGELDRAEERFKLAIQADANRFDALSGYGNTLFARGDLDRAIRYLTQACELAPNHAGTLAHLGRAYLAKGMIPFAVQALTRSLALDPQQPLCRVMLAEAEHRAGNPAGAEAALQPLLAGTPPEQALGHVALGDLALARGENAKAHDHYQAAQAADPQNVGAAEALTRMYLGMDQPEAALAVLDVAIAATPNPVDLLRRKAQVLAILERHAEGAEALARAASLRDDPAIYADLATARALAGDWEGASDAAAHVGDGAGRISAQARIVAARAALERGDEAAAQAALARIDRDAQDPEQRRVTDALKGVLDDRLGRFDRALDRWLAAHRAYPGEAPPPLTSVPADPLKDAIEAARSVSHPLVARRPAALLLGSPGSGVEVIAALLSDQPGIALRVDRFGTDPRRDWITDPASAAHVVLSDVDALQRLARRYARPLERAPWDPERTMIDWVPTFDARVLPLLHAVFGEMKLVIVGRDPRDALLNWIALGGAHRYRVDDPEAAAAWLRLALDHLAHAAKLGRFKLLAIDSDRFAADPAKTMATLGQFLEQPALVPGSHFRRVMRQTSGLPSRLAAGRWQAYAPQLEKAYARL